MLVTEQKILRIYLCTIIKSNPYDENKITISIWKTFHFGVGFGARHLDDFQKRYWTKREREYPATPDCELNEAA